MLDNAIRRQPNDTTTPEAADVPGSPASGINRDVIAVRVFADQIAALYRLTPFSLVSSLIATSLVWWLLADSVPRQVLNSWYLVALLVNAVRYLSLLHYQRTVQTDPNTRKWALQFTIGAVANGALWGMCGTVLLPIDNTALSFALIAILGVIPGIGHSSLGPYKPAFYAFILPFVLPMAIWLVYLSDRIHLAIGVAAFVYLFVLLSIGRRSDREHVATYSQRIENEMLMAEITAARLSAERAAARLREEIAQRKQAETRALQAKEAAEAASAVKSQFLANMSHEIRTPLNGVIGMVELLRRTEITPRQKRLCETIASSSSALLAVLNNILDFSKIEAGSMVIEHIPFRLDDLLEETLQLFADKEARKQIELVCDLGAIDGLTVHGDPNRLRQVLTNLISNGIKFTEQGVVALNATIETSTPTTRRVRFEVSDTGIGMDSAALSKVFDSFVQADGSTSRRYGGTGLGLTICRRLVELMGGQLQAQSSPGSGSRFGFELELPVEETRMHEVSLTGRRILVVDDSNPHLAMLQRLLASWGAIVNTADSADAAIAILNGPDQEIIDAILLDETLGTDGFQPLLDYLESIRNPRPPSVVLMAAIGALPGLEASNPIFAHAVAKPIRRADLLAALAETSSGRTGDEPKATQAPAMLPLFPGITALIAEDNIINQEVAEQLLASLDIKAIVVSDGQQAISVYERERPNLVFMDCQMPHLDGYGATDAIRKLESRQGWPRIPVIALTANALQGDRERCLASGMDDFLGKPFTMHELVAVVRRWAKPPSKNIKDTFAS